MGTGPRRNLRCAVALLPWLAVACGPAPAPDARPLVAVSVLPQAWVVERLAGELVNVAVMIPPGASPATHEPDLSQRRALERAVLYVKVGHPHFPFEATWLDPLLGERPDLTIVDCAAGLERFEHDPHLWLSPSRMRAMAEPIAHALIAALPAEADSIRLNAAAFEAELATTEGRVREILTAARGKSFVVQHPAWGYLAEDYGLIQIAVQDENREPDPRELAELIATARELDVQVIFSQPHFDATSARVVADEVGASVEMLDPLAEDWARNLIHVAERLAAEARG
ncbi:MAG: zinc ABC transporter substrate-binding protein [Deltaproteobacteria bacterium]|nr:zinc ABC transporter substrate-binding protein [Deltaproteobacteria bacterium]